MLFQALFNLAPGAQFTVSGNTVTWLDENIAKPSDEDIQTEIARLEAEYPLNELREKRNSLIAETDWWVLPDRTPTHEQLDYRQALRDITNTYNNLNDVVWPTKPE